MIFADAGDERALARSTPAAGTRRARSARRECDSGRRARARRRGRRRVDAAVRRSERELRLRCAATFRRARHARGLVPETIAAGLELARERITDYHARQKPAEIRYRTADLSEYAFLSRPLQQHRRLRSGRQRVAAVDGADDGRAGEGRWGRPRRRRRRRRSATASINPAILYACSFCEVDELYAVGGAQAIGALAYGTATVARGRQDRRTRQRLRHRGEAPGVRRVRDRRAWPARRKCSSCATRVRGRNSSPAS